jgi:hypothetical protein
MINKDNKFELWVVNEMEIKEIRRADSYKKCVEIMKEYTVGDEYFTIVEYDDNNNIANEVKMSK